MAIGRKTGGRRRGTRNKATAERQAAIAAAGITPLEVMLQSTRWAHAKAIELTGQLDADPSLRTSEAFNQMLRFRQLAVEWAHFAAAYVHPRLAPVAHSHIEADGTPVRPVLLEIHYMETPPTATPEPLGEACDELLAIATERSEPLRVVAGTHNGSSKHLVKCAPSADHERQAGAGRLRQ